MARGRVRSRAAAENVSEFRCDDCGADVVALGLVACLLPPLCAVCAWLAAEFQDDPAERARVRAMLEAGGSG